MVLCNVQCPHEEFFTPTLREGGGGCPGHVCRYHSCVLISTTIQAVCGRKILRRACFYFATVAQGCCPAKRQQQQQQRRNNTREPISRQLFMFTGVHSQYVLYSSLQRVLRNEGETNTGRGGACPLRLRKRKINHQVFCGSVTPLKSSLDSLCFGGSAPTLSYLFFSLPD